MNWMKLSRFRRRRTGVVCNFGGGSFFTGYEEQSLINSVLSFLLKVVPATIVFFTLPFVRGGGGDKEGEISRYLVMVVEERQKEVEPPMVKHLLKPVGDRVIQKSEVRKERRMVKRNLRKKKEEEEKSSSKEDKTKAVFGIDRGSTVSSGSSFSVPVGDSLMVEHVETHRWVKPVEQKEKPGRLVAKIYDEEKVKRKPKCIKRKTPRYTDEALEENIEGKVKLIAIIDEKGKVVSVRVVEGLGYGLDEECIRAVNNSVYKPAFIDGKAVRCRVKITFNFRLE